MVPLKLGVRHARKIDTDPAKLPSKICRISHLRSMLRLGPRPFSPRDIWQGTLGACTVEGAMPGTPQAYCGVPNAFLLRYPNGGLLYSTTEFHMVAYSTLLRSSKRLLIIVFLDGVPSGCLLYLRCPSK